MDADSENEKKRIRDAIQMIETIQSMIDVSADRLEGLRTQCSTSAELTQQEIRTLEGKLVKHFSRQLVIKAQFVEEIQRELGHVPSLRQWLRVVGLSVDAIESVLSRVSSLELLRDRSEHELRAMLCGARDEEVRRLCRAMQRLRTYTEALARGEGSAELPLYWDSWERHVRGSPRARDDRNNDNKKGGKSPTTPINKRKQNSHLPAPPAQPSSLTKSRSHESQLSVKPDTSDHSDNSQSSAAVCEVSESPPGSPRDPDPDPPPRYYTNTIPPPAPRSPRTPTVSGCMAHDIAHRFTKTFNMIATCDYCDKQMLFGSGLKCKECKFKCHRDCESKVPPSCGLPPEFVTAFKEKFHKDGGLYLTSVSSGRTLIPSLTPLRRRPPPTAHHHAVRLSHTMINESVYDMASISIVCLGLASSTSARQGFGNALEVIFIYYDVRRSIKQNYEKYSFQIQGNPDSSSNTSSCNSSTPSSPALAAPAPAPATPQAHHHHHHITLKQQFHFPDVKPAVSSPSHTSAVQSPARSLVDKDELTASIKSVLVCSEMSTRSVGTPVERHDSRHDQRHDSRHDASDRWPRQNSLSMKEWDIPYDELKLFEVIGTGRFGTVYRGSWHGAVAVKLLHVNALSDHTAPLDTFKHEVATFRKTRHENLVLFMGACMKPPRLAIVTSLCKGMTLYTHIHLRKDKFTANKSVIVAQQISQGMGYLHARGIVHKDLKTKNIFLENGKVVITDFGLFSVTKLCFGNNARGDSLGIPPGWLCYLAPELHRALRPIASLHLPFSKATDVYAFGTVWYELLCGEYPFKGQPPEAVIWQVGKGVKQSLNNMQASRDIKDILMLCWAYRSSERPDFPHLLSTLEKLPRKRLARSPSHPVHLSRSADSVF
ncbi:kinase suppressor of Ras 2 [Danaus plexippus]|uniref:kinase suppressor of Ras 2 n=1 Tax=Danaus plexippus TaxID=13037 RepID=UPI002AAFCB06|nr:kinase suppressor of Ras 2 [Danaus plexippus]